MTSEQIIEMGIQNPTMLGIALALTHTYDEATTDEVFADLIARLDRIEPDQPSCS